MDFSILQSLSNRTLVKVFDILLAEDKPESYHAADMVADAYTLRNPSNGIVTAWERFDTAGNRVENWSNYCQRNESGMVILPVKITAVTA